MSNITKILIGKLRDDFQYTQSMIAKKLNVDQKTISNWERGITFPTIVNITDMCDLLNLELIIVNKS